MKIGEIAEIRTGYSFREAIVASENGDLPVIQFKDVGEIAVSSTKDCVYISSEKIKSSHFLKFNDVLLSNRGNYKSSVFKCHENCIASGVFFVLTLKNNEFLPEFVATYLNSSAGQKKLLSRQNKSGLKAIIRSELEQVELPNIPLEKQKQIVEFFSLYQKEVEIIEKIQQNKKKLVDFIISKEFKE